MAKTEKIAFILEQVRLCLARKDYVRYTSHITSWSQKHSCKFAKLLPRFAVPARLPPVHSMCAAAAARLADPSGLTQGCMLAGR